MASILIVGGHGKVALLTAPLLVAQGDAVTSVIRNPDHQAEVAATGARPLVADVESTDVEGLTELVRGHDVVIWSAGAGGGDATRTYAVDRDAAIRSMEAAVAAGVQRYVMVSYHGARADHGVSPDHFFHAYAEAKAAADDHLRSTSLDHTILGPGRLTLDEPTGLIDVIAPEEEGDDAVTRADVASAIVATLADDSTIRRSIGFRNGSTPIAEAIRA